MTKKPTDEELREIRRMAALAFRTDDPEVEEEYRVAAWNHGDDMARELLELRAAVRTIAAVGDCECTIIARDAMGDDNK